MKTGISIAVACAALAGAVEAPAVVHTVEEGGCYFNNGHSGGRSLARDPGGRLWCAYQNYQHPGVGEIRVSYSDDGGAQWTGNWLTGPDGPLYSVWPDTGGEENPALVADAEGTVHVIWCGSSGGEGWVRHAMHTPGPWDVNWFGQRTVEEYTVDPLEPGSTPAAALDSAGRIHAVWSRKIGGASTKKNVYYAVYSGGRQGSWSAPRRLHPADGRDQIRASIAVDPSDNVFVCYGAQPDSGPGEIRLLSGADLGLWESVTDSAGSQSSPCIACDPDGNLHVAWLGKDDDAKLCYDLYYRMREAGGPWRDIERVNNAATSCHGTPSIAVDLNGNAYIVSEGYASGENDYCVVRHTKMINDVGWGDGSALVALGGNWAVKETRTLQSFWPVVGGVSLNIPKNKYAYLFDVYTLDPMSGEAGDFGVRAGIPEGLAWQGQNYAELRVVPPLTGGLTYAPGEQVNLEWKVFPEAFPALGSPHNIYFGAWRTCAVEGRSASLDELFGGGGYLYLYKGEAEGWEPYSGPRPAWPGVTFPLPEGETSGIMVITVPEGVTGKWVFVAGIADPETGAFISSPEIACSQEIGFE